jgi:hypothetical protein
MVDAHFIIETWNGGHSFCYTDTSNSFLCFFFSTSSLPNTRCRIRPSWTPKQTYSITNKATPVFHVRVHGIQVPYLLIIHLPPIPRSPNTTMNPPPASQPQPLTHHTYIPEHLSPIIKSSAPQIRSSLLSAPKVYHLRRKLGTYAAR